MSNGGKEGGGPGGGWGGGGAARVGAGGGGWERKWALGFVRLDIGYIFRLILYICVYIWHSCCLETICIEYF
jgi:hypothetical protein